MKQKTLTLKQLYKVGTVKLAEEGIEEFSLDAGICWSMSQVLR